MLIGVGMDSLKAHWREWGLFDQGSIPIGHMHSDFLQIAVERGIPALMDGTRPLELYRTVPTEKRVCRHKVSKIGLLANRRKTNE